jgi:hypothetical protein
MAINLDFGKLRQRVCAAGAGIATGVVASATGDTTSAAGIVASVMASVGASVLASDIQGHLARRLGRSREVFRHHDLSQAVGRAIALVIEQTADEPRLQDAPKALKALSQKAPAHWETLSPLTATNETIASLAETELVHLIAVDGDDLGSLTALEPDTWADVVGWMAELEKIVLRPSTIVLLADRIHRRFPSAFREILKHDFATDGRAYAGLEMLIWGELVGALAELKQEAGALRADLQEALKSILGEVVAGVERLRTESQGDRRATLDRMGDLVGSLRGDVLGGQEQILVGIEQVLQRLAELPDRFQAPSAAAQSLANAVPAPLPAIAPVPSAALPPPRNARFVPRMDRDGGDVLEALHAKPKTVHRAVLHGMPAVGKTQAALEYAYRYSEDRRHYRDVFWTIAETEDQLRAGLLGIATRLGLLADRPVDEVLNAVRMELEKRDGWLMVLDNALDLRMVARYLSTSKSGRVLVTTTRPESELHVLGALLVELTHFHDHADGARFLLRLAGQLERDQSLEEAHPEDAAAAQALSEEVGGLPLALDQAAAYIEATHGSPHEYLDQYRRRGEELRRLRTPIPGDDRDHANVTVTFTMVFERLEIANPATADLLRLLAFFAPNAIPEEILTAGAAIFGDRLGPAVSTDLPLTRMPALRARLMTRDPRTATLSVHRLVQDVLRDRMDEPSRKLWAERAVRALNLAVPEVERLDLDQIDRTLPHLRACALYIDRYRFDFSEAGRLLDKTGCQLYYLARYDESLPLLDRALAITEAALGTDHLDTARTLNNNAISLQKHTDYVGSEALFRRALTVREAKLGPDHPDTATSLNNLAHLLQMRGKLTEAEPSTVAHWRSARSAWGPITSTPQQAWATWRAC